MKIGLTLTWTKNQSLKNLSGWNYSCEVTGYQAHVSKKKANINSWKSHNAWRFHEF